MNRPPNTRRDGSPFDRATVEAVWEKATPIPKIDFVRKDSCGANMAKQDYGHTSAFGWEVDHIKPVALGGGDELDNLQPLHWQNNRHKGDNYPDWECKKKS